MDKIDFLRQLAVIIIFAKVFGLLARKLKAPQVAGEIIAGLIIGPSIFGKIPYISQYLGVQQSEPLSFMAEIGVIMLMFNAGLGTNINDLKKSGAKATIIACCGVFIPLIAGTVLYMCFYGFDTVGSEEFYKALYIGTILTATSVSITVQTLKEMGKLNNFLGQTIVSAAIIDDVIGIIVLTIVIGFKNPSEKIWLVLVKTAAFFVFAIVFGFLFYKLFKKADSRWTHTRRIPIMGLALAFIMSYVAQKFFGVADITGAYIAGVILCSTKDSNYIQRKMDVNQYMLFGPVFFCSIGLQTNIQNIDLSLILFSLAFVVVGMASKVVGCGGISRLLGFKGKDCLKIGCGMMTRGEVALIVAQRGLSSGLLSSEFFTAVILLIIISSISTPLLLKALYAKDPQENNQEQKEESAPEAIPSK